MSAKKYIDLKDAAAELGSSYYILREDTKRGRLTAYKIGRRVVTTREDLAQYIDNCRLKPVEKPEKGKKTKFAYVPGMKLRADGSCEYPDGKRILPDGTVEYPKKGARVRC